MLPVKILCDHGSFDVCHFFFNFIVIVVFLLTLQWKKACVDYTFFLSFFLSFFLPSPSFDMPHASCLLFTQLEKKSSVFGLGLALQFSSYAKSNLHNKKTMN